MGRFRVAALFVPLMLLSVIFLPACGGNKPSVVKPSTTHVTQVTTPATYDLSVVITVGNRSWIPINRNSRPADDPSFVLHIVKAFEDAHPELEVIPGGWKIEKDQDALGSRNYFYGIWIDHRPKSK